MIADVAGFIACDGAADRYPLPGASCTTPTSDQVKPTAFVRSPEDEFAKGAQLLRVLVLLPTLYRGLADREGGGYRNEGAPQWPNDRAG
ncbi:hypothetical protein ACVHNB_18825 [Streptomyces sp. YJ-C3]